MRRVDGFLLGDPAATPTVGDDLFDEVDIGEAPLAELPQDSEPVIVDPHIPAGVHGVVEGVQPRERASHRLLSLLLFSSPNFISCNAIRVAYNGSDGC